MNRVDGALRWARWVIPAAAGLILCTAAIASSTTVTTHHTKRGTDLAASNGHTLYMFTSDKTGKSSACNSSCAKVWLPLLTSGRPVAAKGSGVNAKLLGTIKRGRSVQVTYNGHPLYQYTGDKQAGQINGEGANQFRGRWYILNTSGNPVKPKASGGGGGGTVCNPICQGY